MSLRVIAPLLRDRCIRLSLVALVAEAFVYNLPLMGVAPREAFGANIVLMPFVALAALAAFDGLHRLPDAAERRFWTCVGAAFVIWVVTILGAEALQRSTHGTAAGLLVDVAYVLMYVPLVMGLEYRPHMASGQQPRQLVISRHLRWVGITVLFAGWFWYFVIIPAQYDPAYSEILPPVSLLYVAADAVLAIRLITFMVTSTSRRWRLLYGWMTTGVIVLCATDALEAAVVFGWVPLRDGTWLDVAWVAAPLCLLVATRLRHVLVEYPGDRRGVRNEARDLEAERVGSLLVAAAASFPVLNVLTQSVLTLPPAVERAQDSAALLGMLSLAALAAVAYYLLERDRYAAERAQDAMAARLREATKLAAVSRLAAVTVREIGGHAQDARLRLDSLHDALPSTNEWQDTVATVRADLDAVIAFTHGLRAVSRQLPLRPMALGLDATVGELIPAVRDAAEPATVTVHLGAGPLTVLVDRGALRDILLTLADHARNAMPDSGTLTVASSAIDIDGHEATARAVRAGRYGRIDVTDSGGGLGPDVVAHIFEPFYDARDTGSGRGLGMASAYAAAAQLGGSLRVAWSDGSGTSFEILFPVAPLR